MQIFMKHFRGTNFILVTKSHIFHLFQVGNTQSELLSSMLDLFRICVGAFEVIQSLWGPTPHAAASYGLSQKHSTYTCVPLADDCVCCHEVYMSFLNL